jgi:CheY-like chemotaxis protein
MTHRFFIWLIAFLVTAISLECAPQLLAQDDPFGDPFAAKPDPAAPAAADRPIRLDPRAGNRAKIDAIDEDPIVLAIQETNPTKPSELLRAVSVLADIGRIELAKPYLEKLMALELDDQALFDLTMEYGSDTFLRLRQIPGLLPDSAIFARRVSQGTGRYVRNPDRIAMLVGQVGDASPEKRFEAKSGLLMAREDAIQPLMQALLDDSRAADHANLLMLLATIGEVSNKPLLEIASSNDSASFAKAAQALTIAKDKQVIPQLLAKRLNAKEGSSLETFTLRMLDHLADSQPNKETTKAYLENRLKEIQSQANVLAHDLTPLEVWNWDVAAQTLVKTAEPMTMTLRRQATTLARVLRDYAIASESSNLAAAGTRFWITQLDYAKRSRPADEVVMAAEFAEFTLTEMESTLVQALRENQIEAAIGALELLGEKGNAELLVSSGGQPAPVAHALNHKNRRVQFAALQAIAKWKPTQAFAGSSHYLRALAWFAGTYGEAAVLVIVPDDLNAEAIGGTIRSLGFQADTTNAGRQFLNRAVTRTDYAFAVISQSADEHRPLELIQRLRRDPRSSGLPVALIGEQDQLPRLKEIADTDSLTVAFPWPATPDLLQLIDEQMARLMSRDYLTNETRVKQATLALDSLLEIAEHKQQYPFFDLFSQQAMIIRGLSHPDLAEKSIKILSFIGSSEAQRELINLVNQEALPIEVRQKAADSFAFSIKQRGILLTKGEILQQYDRYNDSRMATSREVLGAVLDAMEAPVLQDEQG